MAKDIRHGIFNGAGVRQQHEHKPISFASLLTALQFIKNIRKQSLITTDGFLYVGEVN